MRAQGGGTVVQLSSQGGRLAFPGTSACSAAKFAPDGWSEALAAEVRLPLGVEAVERIGPAYRRDRAGIDRPIQAGRHGH